MKKEYIPNILTSIRIILTPIIIILGLFNKINLVIILITFCALTDLLDGKLARKWNVISKTGAKLDTIADKIFGIGIIISLIKNNNLLIFVLVLEILIALTNLYYYYSNKKIESLMIGKIKTTILFSALISCVATIYFGFTSKITTGFIYSTINLQFLCLIEYFINFINYKKITVEDNITHQNIMDETIKINNLNELIENYKEF